MTEPQSKRLLGILSAVAFVVFGCGSNETTSTATPASPTTIEAEEEASSSTLSTSSTTLPATTAPQASSTTIAATTTQAPSPASTVLSASEAVDRRLPTIDVLTPPANNEFTSTVLTPAPAEVIERSTWTEECPVAATDLSYAQVSFFGFDGEFHTGEMLVHNDSVDDLVRIFARLHEMQFPIEQMKVVSQEDLARGPDGDPNNTTVFTCRRSVSSERWSRHAFGDAIDINPFHNPYVSTTQVIPSLATAYVDRDRDVPGLISQEVRQMFADIGWGWGGEWNTVKDWMHFSATGG